MQSKTAKKILEIWYYTLTEFQYDSEHGFGKTPFLPQEEEHSDADQEHNNCCHGSKPVDFQREAREAKDKPADIKDSINQHKKEN